MIAKYVELQVRLQSLIASMRDEEGQDLIEYALLAGLISIIAVVSITAAGQSVSTLFANVAAAIP